MRSIKYFFALLFSMIMIAGCADPKPVEDVKKVKTGADLLLSKNFNLIENKSVGIVTNHTGLLSNGTHLVDTLFSRDDVNVKVLFGPEHGIRGDAPDGLKIKDGTDSKTGLPVYSLYGKIRKPTPEMLDGVDILIFDIQDIGARFYTFISTMFYVIQSGAENNIPVIILDRPNPIGGEKVEGPICSEDQFSFVGIAPIPIRHGMTVGELARFFNEKGLIGENLKADLTIVKMQNWKRDYYYDDCQLTWVNPSPNMPSLETAIVYPGLCLIEGTNISEGRGTYDPFLKIGAPFINKQDLNELMNSIRFEGIEINPVSFEPVSIENMSTSPKYKNEACEGVSLEVTDRNKFNSVEFGIYLIHSINKLYPEKFEFRDGRIDRLFGQTYLREMISAGNSAEEIIKMWESDTEKFKAERKDYLLY
jgi:uncharacterized protein YbbC (DUF1343 family)